MVTGSLVGRRRILFVFEETKVSSEFGFRLFLPIGESVWMLVDGGNCVSWLQNDL